jgi:hypothetical protein
VVVAVGALWLGPGEPAGAQDPGSVPVIAGDPEFLIDLYRGDFSALGTGPDVVAEIMVIGQAAGDVTQGGDYCPGAPPVDLGIPNTRVLSAMTRVGERYRQVMIAAGLGARGHPTYRAVVPWMVATPCDDPTVRRIAANAIRYIVWLDDQGTTAANSPQTRRGPAGQATRTAPASPLAPATFPYASWMEELPGASCAPSDVQAHRIVDLAVVDGTARLEREEAIEQGTFTVVETWSLADIVRVWPVRLIGECYTVFLGCEARENCVTREAFDYPFRRGMGPADQVILFVPDGTLAESVFEYWSGFVPVGR